MTALIEDGSFHAGETAMRSLVGVPPGGRNPTFHNLPDRFMARAVMSPLMAVGALDQLERPWVTVWGGGRQGVCVHVAPRVLGLNGVVDWKYDPVIAALYGGKAGSEQTVKVGGQDGGRLMAALGFDLETRDRIKLAGRFVGGSVSVDNAAEQPSTDGGDGGGVGSFRVGFSVLESMGNCPKYINKKSVKACLPEPELVEEGQGVLGIKSVEMVRQADMFFVSSWDGGETMDVNHRGGPEGFVRVEDTGVDGGKGVLVWPEYSGNRLYQTLGNLYLKPLAGLAIPNYKTGDVLYLTGTTSILHRSEAATLLPHSKLAVRFTVSSSRFVCRGLPFRAAASGEASPYNPPAWPLSSEGSTLPSLSSTITSPSFTASLTKRDILTPNIARLTFDISTRGEPFEWKAGQHITLNFASELDMGYSHMRDDDPGSLNDDFVRTFTISSPPAKDEGSKTRKVEITARRHGAATALLFRHRVGHVELDIPILGVGGSESFTMPLDGDAGSIFVAGGVGITPLLAQAQGLLGAGSRFEVVWSIRADDLGLVVDSVKRVSALGDRIRLFVTGLGELGARGLEASLTGKQLEQLQGGLVKSIHTRRMAMNDVLGMVGDMAKRRFYCCTGPGLKKDVEMWLEGQDSVWEDFGY